MHLPHTIGLVVMALVASLALLGLEYLFPTLGITDTLQGAIGQIDFHSTVMEGMLAFLLFAGALHVDFAFLRDKRWAIGLMATVGVLTWGGLRGGISVALALSLPDIEFKPLILTATYTVVLFSVIVQGLTVKTVVNRTVDPTLL